MVKPREGFLGNIRTLDKDGYGTITASGSRVIDALDPVDPQDLATKAYADSHGGGGAGTWAQALAGGNTTDGYNPEISAGDQLQGEDGNDLTLATTSGGDTVITSDGYEVVRFGVGSLFMRPGDSDDFIIGGRTAVAGHDGRGISILAQPANASGYPPGYQGGAITIEGGDAVNVGGGAVSITAGHGSNSPGGDTSISSGSSGVDNEAASISLSGADTTLTEGGSVNVAAGGAGGGVGGNVHIASGTGNVYNPDLYSGTYIDLIGGDTSGRRPDGYFVAGHNYALPGGWLILEAGEIGAPGGSVLINAGDSASGHDGGDIILDTGAGGAGGKDGYIIFKSDGSEFMRFGIGSQIVDFDREVAGDVVIRKLLGVSHGGDSIRVEAQPAVYGGYGGDVRLVGGANHVGSTSRAGGVSIAYGLNDIARIAAYTGSEEYPGEVIHGFGFAADFGNPIIGQSSVSGGSVGGQSLTIAAQRSDANNGGNLYLKSGYASASVNVAQISMAGASALEGVGGSVQIWGGDSTASGNGGPVEIVAGSASNGGTLTLSSGTSIAGGSSESGTVNITVGSVENATAEPGVLYIHGSDINDVSNTNTGGSVYIYAGNSEGGLGGDVTIEGGGGATGDGYVIIKSGVDEIVRFGHGSSCMQFRGNTDGVIDFPYAGYGYDAHDLYIKSQTTDEGNAGDINILCGTTGMYGSGGSVLIRAGSVPYGATAGDVTVATGWDTVAPSSIKFEAGNNQDYQFGYLWQNGFKIEQGNAAGTTSTTFTIDFVDRPTSGTGRALWIKAQKGSGSPGGDLALYSGEGGTQPGDLVFYNGQDPVAKFDGATLGKLEFSGNRAGQILVGNTTGQGQALQLSGGLTTGLFKGGDVLITAGSSNNGSANVEGADVNIIAGWGGYGGGVGGDVIITGGTAYEGSAYGKVIIRTQGGNTTITEFSDGYVDITGDLAVDGKLYVSGLIDPTGLVLHPQAYSPANNSVWIRQSDSLLTFTDYQGVEYGVMETLAQTLELGNTTSGKYIEVTNGDKIVAEDGYDLVLSADGGSIKHYADTDHSFFVNATPSEFKIVPADANPAVSGSFAYSADIDGYTIAAMGSEDGEQGIYVYVRSGNTWVEEQKIIDAAWTQPYKVALWGDTLAIVAIVSGDRRIDVYTRFDGYWTLEQSIATPTASILFGSDIDLYEDTLVIGATGDDTEGVNAGATFVYTRTAGVWSQQQKLTPIQLDDGDSFGYSVSVWKDKLIAGARDYEFPGQTSQGAAWVYVRSGTTWSVEELLFPEDIQDSDRFGSSVCIWENRVIVGAPGCDDKASNAGAAYIYDYVSGYGAYWKQTQKIYASDAAAHINQYFGGDTGGWDGVSLRGDVAIVGAMTAYSGAVKTGAAYIFERNQDTWVETHKLTPSDGEDNDQYGTCVRTDGTTFIVGSPLDAWTGEEPENHGSLYIYEIEDYFSVVEHGVKVNGAVAFDEQTTVPGGTPDEGTGKLWYHSSDGYAGTYLALTDDVGTTSVVGGIRVISPPAIDGYEHDYQAYGLDIANIVRLDAGANSDLTGIVSDGVLVVVKKLINVSSFNIIIRDEDANSQAENRFLVPGSQDLTLQPDDAVDVFYDVVDQRWRLT
jgi:hypothetical protein